MKHLILAMCALLGVVAVSHAQEKPASNCSPEEQRRVAANSPYVQVAVDQLRRNFTHVPEDVNEQVRAAGPAGESFLKAALSEKGLTEADEKALRAEAAEALCIFTTTEDRQKLETFYTNVADSDLLMQQYMLQAHLFATQQGITNAKLQGALK